ncbi:methylenetetrahydrofolate dehydrogenase/methenyltetrahydrofolate cyclohydrolase FolD [Gottschalkia purinilytica]|uniref:Bifunctional protein FolD n=1 Tax=Gottschalkia purinilytica TaxID=1503 RepID=A0A0L0WDW6_GOTPU|nr:bifunctional 5,10-methylenetetrahydrofolate dehydrogenase/5,10-methenyltetrahydrofolate cyclohydrolase [Gottschalkia purinilytica]KNF09672.1 methylenetetrahydrofolate dehydrogenase/methenyltetrahydrofolate cyclohydrolase FolD [Gottschalkia purinilytica]
MTTINCKEIAANIRKGLGEKVSSLTEKYGEKPFLEIVQVGAHPSSVSYVKSIERTCDNMGVNHRLSIYDENISEEELVKVIETLNSDDSVHGVIIQYPLPQHLDQDRIANTLSPDKDVDCVNSTNLGKLFMGVKGIVPCTPKGMMRILEESGVDLVGKEVVVVGNGRTVGKPISQLLLHSGATVTVCHVQTKDLKKHVKEADVVICAAGKAGLVTGDMVKDGVVVVDAAINVIGDKIVGDADFEEVSKKASLITPVPGGVGTTTNAMLIENLLELFVSHKEK